MRTRAKTPSSAMRVFVFLQFASPPLIRMEDGFIVLPSVRRVSKIMNLASRRFNVHLVWLETQGYITNLSYTDRKLGCRLRLRAPTNVSGASNE